MFCYIRLRAFLFLLLCGCCQSINQSKRKCLKFEVVLPLDLILREDNSSEHHSHRLACWTPRQILSHFGHGNLKCFVSTNIHYLWPDTQFNLIYILRENFMVEPYHIVALLLIINWTYRTFVALMSNTRFLVTCVICPKYLKRLGL